MIKTRALGCGATIGAWIGLLLLIAGNASAQHAPNVLLIVSDDQGTLDLNCYGSKDLQTPNLDALAARGVRFTQFYAASAVCSPSRAAILTGRYPQRAQLPGMAPSRRGREGMPPEQMTIAELLRPAGYRTALFGKWHLGTTMKTGPNNQGFDDFVGFRSGCIDNLSHTFYWDGPPLHDLWRNEQEIWENGTHFSTIIVREAQRFLRENQSRPFFMELAFNTPHYPLQPFDHWREYYEKKLEEPRRSYAAWISTMDESIGKVLATLDELELRDNTLILFVSDQGHSTEERANFGGGNAGPYRGAKFSLLEGGIRVPAIVSLPGKIPQGESRDQLAAQVDFFPTIAEVCGIKLPDRRIDGKTLMPLLKSSAAPTQHETYYWQLGDQWAVREGNWKLVVNGMDTQDKKKLEGSERVFLSDMSRDLTETHNIAAEHADVVDRLTKLHEGWLKDVREQ
ncbi:MAG TPA: sulfatase-like hydrolase/transferase [Humisphaera sp.]|jgi:arylsulfatase A-like enzyme|nr:sulfatase-like hydrolase/transferase [Humisphaera sp.]